MSMEEMMIESHAHQERMIKLMLDNKQPLCNPKTWDCSHCVVKSCAARDKLAKGSKCLAIRYSDKTKEQ